MDIMYGQIISNCWSTLTHGLEQNISEKPGNKEAREGTAIFLIRHSSKRSHFYIFRTLCALLRSRNTPLTWCLLRCCHAEAYLGALISVPCATDRSIRLPELRHCKRHFQTDPDVKFRKPDCCCAAPDGRKYVELRKTGVNEVSLSGAWRNWYQTEVDLPISYFNFGCYRHPTCVEYFKPFCMPFTNKPTNQQTNRTQKWTLCRLLCNVSFLWASSPCPTPGYAPVSLSSKDRQSTLQWTHPILQTVCNEMKSMVPNIQTFYTDLVHTKVWWRQ